MLQKNLKMTNYDPIVPIIYSIDELCAAFELNDAPEIFERVDNIVIQHEKYTFQFSVICYRLFNKSRKRPKHSFNEVSVVKSSIDQKRVLLCKGLLEFIHDKITDGSGYNTLMIRLQHFTTFFNYLNANIIELKLEPKSIEAALIHYSEHLSHKVKIFNQELKVGLASDTASNYQAGLIKFFAFILKIDTIQILNPDYIISRNTKQRVSAQALSENDQEIQFNQYTQLFRRFSSIVLDHERLPLTFELNKESYWIVHYGKIVHSNSNNLLKIGSFNFKENRDYSDAELIATKRFKDTSRRNQSIKRLNQQKELSNTHYSESRLSIAFHACHAYFMHFLFLTGENDSTASAILFNSNYEIQNLEVNFKSIKWRANGKTVSYDIQSEFIDDFKRFLRLREYLIGYYKNAPKSLFLTRYKNKLSSPSTSGDYSCKIRNNFIKIFDKNRFNAPSKNIRVTKSLWIRQNYGGAVSSYILQHSKRTSDSNYTASNFEKSSEEFSDYFSELSKQMITTSEIKNKTPAGNCIEPGLPEIPSKTIVLEGGSLNCGEPNSCLFCKKFRVHADETDIRKLFSIKYLISQSELLANSTEHFNRIYKSTIERIDWLINQISEIDTDNINLIDTVRSEVFEHEQLSDYWYRKLELLEELGVM